MEGDPHPSGGRCSPKSYFYPRPPGGGRLFSPSFGVAKAPRFLSTPSGWRATTRSGRHYQRFYISIHALRVEGDSPPCRPRGNRKISIHALRVEGDDTTSRSQNQFRLISIHALRVEGDTLIAVSSSASRVISIHALRVEGDDLTAVAVVLHRVFLSTPSGWRATVQADTGRVQSLFLSTPSGWRATHKDKITDISLAISIHALRVEGDAFFASCAVLSASFLSTPSGWRATGS